MKNEPINFRAASFVSGVFLNEANISLIIKKAAQNMGKIKRAKIQFDFVSFLLGENCFRL